MGKFAGPGNRAAGAINTRDRPKPPARKIYANFMPN
jgi:hypothetical protein